MFREPHQTLITPFFLFAAACIKDAQRKKSAYNANFWLNSIDTNIVAMGGMVGKETYSSTGVRSACYYVKNHLGSTMIAVNSSGTVLEKVQYDACANN